MRGRHSKKKENVLKCPYCGKVAILRSATYIYKENTKKEYLYVCAGFPECNSYVGVHPNTKKPLGTLANGDLRHKRIKAHKTFDTIWKEGIMTRSNAYRWLREKFSLTESMCHIASFSEYQCEEVIKVCQQVLERNQVDTSLGGGLS